MSAVWKRQFHVAPREPVSESGELCCLRIAPVQEMVYHCKSSSLQELKVQLTQRGINCHMRSLIEVLVNGGVALKT